MTCPHTEKLATGYDPRANAKGGTQPLAIWTSQMGFMTDPPPNPVRTHFLTLRPGIGR